MKSGIGCWIEEGGVIQIYLFILQDVTLLVGCPSKTCQPATNKFISTCLFLTTFMDWGFIQLRDQTDTGGTVLYTVVSTIANLSLE